MQKIVFAIIFITVVQLKVVKCTTHQHQLPWTPDEVPLDAIFGGQLPQEVLSLLTSKRVVRSLDGENEGEGLETTTLGSQVAETTEQNENSSKTFETDEETELIESICNIDDDENERGNSTAWKKAKLACLLLKKLNKKMNSQSSTNLNKSNNARKIDGSQYLPDDYNKYEVPRIKFSLTLPNGTLYTLDRGSECAVYISVRSIRDFDETNEEATVDMDLILVWFDGNILNKVKSFSQLEKLKTTSEHKAVVLTPDFLKKLWLPDVYFEEIVSVTQPSFLGNSLTVILHPATGLLTYRSRMLAKLNCAMDFSYYPADTQNCKFTLKSFSYAKQLLELEWYSVGIYLHETSDPNFKYQITSVKKFDSHIPLGPNATDKSVQYTHLQFTLKARRKMTYHLVQTYFVSIFFVIVTWLCFLIPVDMFEVRVGIAMSTLLTLTAMFSAVRQETPSASYVKAIDVWMLACILFIFTALAGFTVTAWVKRGLKKLYGSHQDDGVTLEILDRKESDLSDHDVKRQMKKYRIIMMLIEHFAVYILFAAFVVFNIFYWIWLFVESKYLDWDPDETYNMAEE